MATTNTFTSIKPDLKDTYSNKNKDRWKKLKGKLKLC